MNIKNGPIKNICLNCNSEFIGSNKYRRYKFCSKKCQGEYTYKNNINYTYPNCLHCNAKLTRRKIREDNRYFCNSSCQMQYDYDNNLRDLKGIHTTHENLRIKAREKLKKGHKYFNRKVEKDGYWHIYVPLSGWRREHLYLWEKKHGKIPEGFEIHHIDEDKTNNDFNNLTLLTKKEHRVLHSENRRRNKAIFEREVLDKTAPEDVFKTRSPCFLPEYNDEECY